MKMDRKYKKPDPTPLIICLFLLISFCVYLFFMGCNAVRLWYYRGALGPAPEKYLIMPLHRKKKAQGHTRATSTGVDIHDECATATLHPTAAGNRKTVFPAIAESVPSPANPFSDEHAIPSSQPYWATIPATNIEEVDESGLHGFEEHEDPELVRRYVAEERRISRLPAFEQDDCGDGTEFPSVPCATQAVEARRLRGTMADTRKILLDFRLTEEHRTGKWLTTHTIDPKMQVARERLLDKEQEECVQVRPDGEIPCEELLDSVVHQLCGVTALFNEVITNGRKHIRSRINFKEYAVTRPFEYHPIELCARLAGEDFNVFTKDEFTQKWYLQASATLFPAGWRMSKHIGKPLSSIVNDLDEPFALWSTLSPVLDALQSSKTLHIRTSTFIQTTPATSPNPQLQDTLFTLRPQDLFSGSIGSLQPANLHVRREHQTFRTLPKSGAVVMSTCTTLTKLTDINNMKGQRELMEEIDGWGEEEARFKGRELWEVAVRAHCEGGVPFRDDKTVIDGDLSVLGY